MSTVAVEEKVEKLLACLDEDSRHIERSLSQLNQLRVLVIKRDDEALRRLLEDLQAQSDQYSRQQRERQAVRMDLANALGCSPEKMTLSALQKKLPQAQSEQVSRVKAKLKGLVAELRKEYAGTAMLLSECSRLNNLLLKSIFNLGGAGDVYYGANGAVRRRNETAFVNLQF